MRKVVPPLVVVVAMIAGLVWAGLSARALRTPTVPAAASVSETPPARIPTPADFERVNQDREAAAVGIDPYVGPEIGYPGLGVRTLPAGPGGRAAVVISAAQALPGVDRPAVHTEARLRQVFTNDFPGRERIDAGPAWVITFTGTAPVLRGVTYRRSDLPIACSDVEIVSAVTGRGISSFQTCDTAPTA